MDAPLISICIPAYKNVSYLRRLLESISIQTFTDFEVIVTDDSPDNSVSEFVAAHKNIANLSYHRNREALGTPENWNEGIRKAQGQWIKIMHDDDWFSGPRSLEEFAKQAVDHPHSFLFSAYTNHYIESKRTEIVLPSKRRMKWMLKEPYSLLSKNIIGPPSVTMHRNDGSTFYDNRTKWVVDIDFYIRRLENEQVYHIKEPLINVGMSSQQVTVDCINNRKVQVPENFYLLYKVGERRLINLLVYDAWWRLVRNLEITRMSEITDAGYTGPVPLSIQKMIETQRQVPRSLLTNGVFSKSFMFVHYLLHRNLLGN